jgi:hypothetical protein
MSLASQVSSLGHAFTRSVGHLLALRKFQDNNNNDQTALHTTAF